MAELTARVEEGVSRTGRGDAREVRFPCPSCGRRVVVKSSVGWFSSASRQCGGCRTRWRVQFTPEVGGGPVDAPPAEVGRVVHLTVRDEYEVAEELFEEEREGFLMELRVRAGREGSCPVCHQNVAS